MRPQLGTWPATQARAVTGRELNPPTLGSQASAENSLSSQLIEPHQPGLNVDIIIIFFK